MRVLIVGINYSPELTGIGPYTAGLAEHLASRGDDVTVITGLPHYPDWRIAGRTSRTHDPGGVARRRSRHPRRPLRAGHSRTPCDAPCTRRRSA